VNLGLLPLVAMSVCGNSVATVLWSSAIMVLMSSSAAIAWIVARQPLEFIALRVHVNDIARYALPRIPGAFAFGGLFALPATITAHVAGIEAAGVVAFACTLLTCASTIVSPIGIALMPWATGRVACGDVESLRKMTSHVVAATAIWGGLMTLAVLLFAGWGARLFLGDAGSDFSSILRIVALGISPYTLFVSCRAIVDGASARAINAKNTSLALAAFSLLAGAVVVCEAGLTSLLAVWVAALCLLAGLTLKDCFRLLGSAPTPSQARASETGVLVNLEGFRSLRKSEVK
jgi:O-antigen/teichoic acid export membrane protein